MTTNSVFMIQPCDLRVRFRKNLSPTTITEIPRSTTALDISGLNITIDEEVYKDLQYLSKFFSWHSKVTEYKKHFKFRPPYNLSVKGNTRAYWLYAINSTIYHLRKAKKEKNIRTKR